MNSTVMICVPCYNRKAIAGLCLSTLPMAQRGSLDRVFLYNDGSTEYDEDWLATWADYVKTTENIGIEAQRREHLKDFWASDFTHLYFTDCDAIHDPFSIEAGLDLQSQNAGMPVCLYNTKAHADMLGNTIKDDPEQNVIFRRLAPGISYLLSRDHVKKIMTRIKDLQNFDWQIPEWLGDRFVISRTSYVDHIGFGGIHHDGSYGFDGGDRALNPSEWLVRKRKEIVEKLSKK